MSKEADEPSMFDDIQTVLFASNDSIGKAFRVLDDKLRLCLICEGVFTRQGAAGHANVACYPRTRESEDDEGIGSIGHRRRVLANLGASLWLPK